MRDSIIKVNLRTYAREAEPDAPARDEQSTVTVVLVGGGANDYAAYVGIGSPSFVARHGDKLSFEEARIHFPVGLEKDRYRV